MPLLTRITRKLAAKLPKSKPLSTMLKEQGLTKWLDVGSDLFEEGFTCLNIDPLEAIDPDFRDRYVQLDLRNATNEQLDSIGQYDLVRLQHVFEHFSPEEGLGLLHKLARLLKPGGYLLITVPDLAVHARAYLQGYRHDGWYRNFAEEFRIPSGAPASFVFSCFAHQHGYYEKAIPGQAHCWCYDEAGLRYQIERSGKYSDIKALELWNSLAEIPFTHNRQREDLCMLARRREDRSS